MKKLLNFLCSDTAGYILMAAFVLYVVVIGFRHYWFEFFKGIL